MDLENRVVYFNGFDGFTPGNSLYKATQKIFERLWWFFLWRVYKDLEQKDGNLPKLYNPPILWQNEDVW